MHVYSQGLAALGVASTSLAEDRLAVAVRLQEADEVSENLKVVLHHFMSKSCYERIRSMAHRGALGVGAAVVAVQVLVNYDMNSCLIICSSYCPCCQLTVKDELPVTTERVGNLDEKRSSLSWEGLSGGPAGAGEEKEILRAGGTDSVDDVLNGVNPGGNVWNIVGFVHQTAMIYRQAFMVYSTQVRYLQDDTLVAAVLLGKLSPDRRKLLVGGTALSNDGIVPTGVVVLGGACQSPSFPH